MVLEEMITADAFVITAVIKSTPQLHRSPRLSGALSSLAPAGEGAASLREQGPHVLGAAAAGVCGAPACLSGNPRSTALLPLRSSPVPGHLGPDSVSLQAPSLTALPPGQRLPALPSAAHPDACSFHVPCLCSRGSLCLDAFRSRSWRPLVSLRDQLPSWNSSWF